MDTSPLSMSSFVRVRILALLNILNFIRSLIFSIDGKLLR